MWIRASLRFLILSLLFPPTGCGGGDDDIGGTPDAAPPVALRGGVQKGPFVLGSSVSVSPVDAVGSPTGQVFNTTIDDDLGTFFVQIAGVGPVSIEADGFYYNESSGALSGAPLTLRAFAEVTASGEQTAYVNVVTHLAYPRVLELLRDGTALDAAVDQAEGELVHALHIGPPGFAVGEQGTALNVLGGDTDPNAYLLAVSAVLAHAAELRGGGGLDAVLQELLNAIGTDLVDDGQLSGMTVDLILQAQATLDTRQVEADLAARLALLGSSAVVPDIDRILDADQDALVNADDPCPYTPTGGFCFRVTTIEVGATPVRVMTGDLDGDGRFDVVTANAESSISVILQNPDGTWAAPVALSAPSSLNAATIADADGDGDQDVLLVSDGVPVLSVFRNDGTGALGAHVDEPPLLPNGANFVALGDFNGDGAADLYGNGSVLLSDGVGGYQAVDFPASCGTRPASGDLDADGYDDVVGVFDFGLEVHVCHGQVGGLAGPVSIVTLASELDQLFLALADFGNDGRLDLVLRDKQQGVVRVVPQDAAGVFGTPIDAADVGPALVVTGDFDGDGDIDIAAVGTGAGSGVSVFLGDGTGALPAPVFLGRDPGAAAPTAIASGAASSQDDLIFANGDGTLTVLEGGIF